MTRKYTRKWVRVESCALCSSAGTGNCPGLPTLCWANKRVRSPYGRAGRQDSGHRDTATWAELSNFRDSPAPLWASVSLAGDSRLAQIIQGFS